MKKFKLFILAFALFAFNIPTAEANPVKPNTKLRTEIVDLLGTNCPYESDKSECTAEVLFTINGNNELIILSVVSPNTRAEGYIKSKLNYKAVDYTSSRAGEIYLLPLRMIREL